MILDRETIRKVIQKITGWHIYRYLPRGVDRFYDIRNELAALQIRTVFDIGANVGQLTRIYLEKFSAAQIYCFEPVVETFHRLQENLKEYDKIHSFKLAFGALKGKGRMVLVGPSDMFFLLGTAKDVPANDASNFEAVDIETLDEFCKDKAISHVNYLKIDTEGGDLDVLRGAKNMLNEQQIDLVDVEAGMNARNRRHVRFEELKGFLEGKGYFLFGIYEQVREWPSGEPHLRRIDAVFVSGATIRSNSRVAKPTPEA